MILKLDSRSPLVIPAKAGIQSNKETTQPHSVTIASHPSFPLHPVIPAPPRHSRSPLVIPAPPRHSRSSFVIPAKAGIQSNKETTQPHSVTIASHPSFPRRRESSQTNKQAQSTNPLHKKILHLAEIIVIAHHMSL